MFDPICGAKIVPSSLCAYVVFVYTLASRCAHPLLWHDAKLVPSIFVPTWLLTPELADALTLGPLLWSSIQFVV